MKNNNFVGVSINTLNVSVIHDMILVGSLNTTQSFTLPPRSDVEVRTGQCGGGAVWGRGSVGGGGGGGGIVGVGHCGILVSSCQRPSG